jgi:hypothetical protein
MSNRRDATNRKPCLRANSCCIGLAKRFTCEFCGFDRIDLIAASGEEKDTITARFAQKDDRLYDLIDLTADLIRSHLCCCGLACLNDRVVHPMREQGRAHAFQ